MSWLDSLKNTFQKGYTDLDGQLGGILPGGAERTQNKTEQAIALANLLPPVQMLRGGVRAAGALAPETFGPTADAAENAWRSITGDRRDRGPSEYTSKTRDELATAIDRAMVDDTMLKDADGFTAVDYPHYNKDGGEHKGPIAYVGGRVWGRKNADGSYELRDDEKYDFNAGKLEDKTPEERAKYKANLDTATQEAWDREDYTAWVANLPDHLAFHTGAGTEGFSIAGKFNRPGEKISSGPSPELPIDSPAPSMSGSYQVKSGDTLTAIANQLGTSVQDLAKKNSIGDVNSINVGMNLSY